MEVDDATEIRPFGGQIGPEFSRFGSGFDEARVAGRGVFLRAQSGDLGQLVERQHLRSILRPVFLTAQIRRQHTAQRVAERAGMRRKRREVERPAPDCLRFVTGHHVEKLLLLHDARF